MQIPELPEALSPAARLCYDQALRLVGHTGGSGHLGPDRQSIVAWRWEEDAVRQAWGLPDDATWLRRVFDLQRQGLAGLCVYAAMAGETWVDEALEEYGTIDISPAGVLALAALYGRPIW